MEARHPERQRRLSGEGCNVHLRLTSLANRRGLRPRRDRHVERLAKAHAPDVVGLRALTTRAPLNLTLISAPGQSFAQPALRAQLEALKQAAREEGRRAILVPKRSIMLRTARYWVPRARRLKTPDA